MSEEYIRKADMERILYSTNNAVRIGELFTELPTYSIPEKAKTDTAKPESDLISRTQAINDYAQCFADAYGMDCGEMFIGVLHQCPTFLGSADIEKIRAEIKENIATRESNKSMVQNVGLYLALEIIDKHIRGDK